MGQTLRCPSKLELNARTTTTMGNSNRLATGVPGLWHWLPPPRPNVEFGAGYATAQAAIDAAAKDLAARQGSDPSTWRTDATGERLTFGFLPKTARWTNRPTFQQIISFDGHRPR
jgi:hypothetical protein